MNVVMERGSTVPPGVGYGRPQSSGPRLGRAATGHNGEQGRPAPTPVPAVATRSANEGAGVPPPRPEAIEALAAKANRLLPAATRLKFEVDREAERVVVNVVDQDSNEVIRQVPDQEMLELVRRMQAFQGSMLSTLA